MSKNDNSGNENYAFNWQRGSFKTGKLLILNGIKLNLFIFLILASFSNN